MREPAVRVVVLLSVLVAAHLGIVSSIILQERPVIWPLHNDTIHRVGRGADFYAVYHAGLNLRRGRNPYENNRDGVTPYWYAFRYLPVVAIAARPLTLLAPRAAYIVWILLIEAFLALLLATLWRRIPGRGVRLAATGMLLINSPYFLELYMGQFTFVSVALCCLALWLPAGQVPFSASVLLKPLTLVALPSLASQRRFWSHGACAILSVALSSAPYFFLHPEQWPTFVTTNFTPRGGLDAGNYGLVRLWQLLVEDANASLVARHWESWVGSLRFATLAATALLVFHSKGKSVVVGVSALLLAHFLTYQHVWEHHMSGVCVLGAALLTIRERRKPFTLVVLFSLLLLSLPGPYGLLDSAKDPSVGDPSVLWPRYASYAAVLPKVLPTVILYLACVIHLCGSGLMSPRDAVRSALTKPTGHPPDDRGAQLDPVAGER
jgi:hypothetical protein